MEMSGFPVLITFLISFRFGPCRVRDETSRAANSDAETTVGYTVVVCWNLLRRLFSAYYTSSAEVKFLKFLFIAFMSSRLAVLKVNLMPA